jgi:hypothetical protein
MATPGAQRWFLIHTACYLVGNGLLFLYNWLIDDGDTWWFYWPLLIWSVILIVHAFVAFGSKVSGSELQQ